MKFLYDQEKNVQLEPEQTDHKCAIVERLTVHVLEGVAVIRA